MDKNCDLNFDFQWNRGDRAAVGCRGHGGDAPPGLEVRFYIRPVDLPPF